MIIEAGEVPDGVLDALLSDPVYQSWGDREAWRAALATALTAWEGRPRDLVPQTVGHDCAWVTLAVQHRDMVFGVKQTDVLQRCDGCGDVRTQVLTGTWTLDQLRG